MPKALITGITGQDGSYLTELLLSMGYEVSGIVRRTTGQNFGNIKHLLRDIRILDGDVTDMGSIVKAITETKPDEIYNLAAQSFVGRSWAEPGLTSEINAVGALNCLEAILRTGSNAKFYQASTSEMFGNGFSGRPMNEQTPLNPRSPYGVAKTFAHLMTRNYRESHKLFAVSGILFNHESPRRGPEFVTRKITQGVARIAAGKQEFLELGNLKAKRDWGHARDYVKAMWMMLQAEFPDDYVIGTGVSCSVESFMLTAFNRAGLNWENHVRVNASQLRPADVDILVADPAKAKIEIGWYPDTTVEQLVAEMVDYDLERER